MAEKDRQRYDKEKVAYQLKQRESIIGTTEDMDEDAEWESSTLNEPKYNHCFDSFESQSIIIALILLKANLPENTLSLTFVHSVMLDIHKKVLR